MEEEIKGRVGGGGKEGKKREGGGVREGQKRGKGRGRREGRSYMCVSFQ